MSYKRFLLCCLSVAFVPSFALAQGTTSRIAGIVTDSTGAVISGVSVTATNEGTHVSYVTKSSSSGSYAFDSLQIGSYAVRAELAGFKQFVSTGNVLSIGLPTSVNIAMQIGGTDQTVEVNGGYDLVQTQSSGNFGGTIDNETLTQLPIVGTSGRNPISLTTFIPGVVVSGSYASGGQVSVNGSRDRAWNYVLDGIDANESSSGGGNSSPAHLNPDMLSEFRVLTSNFTAEYGRNTGGQVLMVTKSGTNQYHGNLFEFYQSPFLRANSPVNKSLGQPRSQFVQNMPGGSLGGPIFKNKTFFFVNIELLHAYTGTSVNRIVYTAAARAGNIRYANAAGARNQPYGTAGASVDANGNPIVPVSTYNIAANDPFHVGLDPSVQSFIGLTPLPNNFAVGDGLNTAGYSFVAPANDRQVDETIKIDHIFSDRNAIFGRWYSGHQNTYADSLNGGLQTFPGAPAQVNTFRQPRNLAINWRLNPTANTTNEVVVGMNRFGYAFVNPALGEGAATTPYNFNNSVYLPRNSYISNNRYLTTYQLVDNYTWVKGAHIFKGGINFRYGREIDNRGSIGSVNVTPQVSFSTTNNPVDIANYNVPTTGINTTFDQPTLTSAVNDLLGRVGSVTAGYVSNSASTAFDPAGTINIMDSRWPEYDFYIQDSWKILPNLVLDYGLRLDARMAPRFRGFPLLVPNQNVLLGAQINGPLTFVPGKEYNDDWNNFGPSVGFAWDPYRNGKTSLRGNFRVGYDRINSFSFTSSVFQGMPGLTYQANDTTSGQDNFAAGRMGVRAQSWAPPVPGTTPTALRTPPPFSANSVTVADPNMRTPKVYMWGLSVQQEMAKDVVFTLTYIGNHGIGLYGGYDSNQVNYRANGFLDAFNTVKSGQDSSLMTRIISGDSRRKAGETGAAFLQRNYASYLTLNNVAGLAQVLGQRIQGDGNSLVVDSGLPANFFKPYSQYLGAVNVLTTKDYSNYNGLQAQIEKRFSDGFLMTVSYTFSKALDLRSYDPAFTTVAQGSTLSSTGTPFDFNNPRLNYAPADFDNTQVVTGYWSYRLPFGRGKKIGNQWNRTLDLMAGGWEISGNGNWYSGRPITFFAGSNTYGSAVGTPASCITPGACSPKMGKMHVESGQSFYFTAAQKALLVTPAAGEFSNLGRNYFRQPGVWNVDATVSKEFRITDSQLVQARLEMQNAANVTTYDTFGSELITSSVFTRRNAGVDGVVNNSPRRMQLAVKYIF
ncbi:TonB-dependent receptor [Edaphobacter modestus]|uniref:TonB-dependent receptor-like protein n=1 Tax=Edaphobacter modestus TaxID=388466 RepID=A0A4Q7YSM5_9BACT|nr:TonB-dependent receptor [Edaphobacter modestus]RZU40560.1 TonB-dependent receptor-like protein [Edaphobacter modestus]